MTLRRTLMSALSADEVAALPPLTGVKIAYDMSHNTSRQSSGSPTGGNINSVVFGNFISRGATITVITSFTEAVLSQYNVLWLEEDFAGTLSSPEKTIVANFVNAGGGVIICCEDWGWSSADYGAALEAFGFGYSPNSPSTVESPIILSGTATQVASHTVTEGVSTIGFPGSTNALTIPEGATPLVYDGDHIGVAISSFGDGHVAVMADELCSDGVASGDNQRLCNNLMTFAAQGGSSTSTTEVVQPGESEDVTVTHNGTTGGARFTGDDFDQATTVTVTLRDPAEDGVPCHAYLLGQTGKCMEITAETSPGVKADLKGDVEVGICLPAEADVDLYKFDNVIDTPKALEEVDWLDCSGTPASQGASRAPRNWLDALAMGITKRVGAWISPKPLYAADNGWGGRVHQDDGFSFFTWASPIPVSSAGVIVSTRYNRDAFAVSGTFDLSATGLDATDLVDLVTNTALGNYSAETGFNPAAVDPASMAVKATLGSAVFSITASSFQWSEKYKRWLYAARVTNGITGMAIACATQACDQPDDGNFTVAAVVSPTQGPLPNHKQFAVQIGHRVQAGLLVCHADGRCTPQHTH